MSEHATAGHTTLAMRGAYVSERLTCALEVSLKYPEKIYTNTVPRSAVAHVNLNLNFVKLCTILIYRTVRY